MSPTTVIVRPNSKTPVRRGMPTLTDRITEHTTLEQRIEAFWQGWRGDKLALAGAQAEYATLRAVYGFHAEKTPEMITPPGANDKLSKGKLPAYGLTLQSHVTTLSDGTKLNACPFAGQCVRVCVLHNGNGAYPDVQKARDYKTEFFATNPLNALLMLGAELRAAVDRAYRKWTKNPTGPFPGIAFRPNMNSDIDWSRVLGATLQHLSGITTYGYSKRPETIGATALTHEAFSWSERATPANIAEALAIGQPIAAVTNRKTGEPIEQWHPTCRVVDADLTDEWMFERNVIGDLSAKGKAKTMVIAGELVTEFDEFDSEYFVLHVYDNAAA